LNPSRFTPGKEEQYPLSRGLVESIGADLDDLSGIEQRYLGGPARRIATIATTQWLTQSHIEAELITIQKVASNVHIVPRQSPDIY